MDRLAIEFICVFGLDPVEFVNLAADLGVRNIGLATRPIVAHPHDRQPWNLLENPELFRNTASALQDRDVRVTLGEGFLIMPGAEIADSAAAMDLLAELGTPRINAMCIEEDRVRAVDQFARFAAMAAERDLDANLEFMPVMGPRNIHEALAIIDESGAANGKVLIDAMHFFRSSSTTKELSGIDPTKIGYAQLCDVPMPAQTDDYGVEARDHRLCPGDGDLPLADLIEALPKNVMIGLEVPMLSKAQTGVSDADRLKPCIEAARRLLG